MSIDKKKTTLKDLLVRAGTAVKRRVGAINKDDVKSVVKVAVETAAPHVVKEVKRTVRGLLPKHR